MDISKLIGITRYSTDKSADGFAITVGFVRRGRKLHLMLQTSDWDDELVDRLLDAYDEKQSVKVVQMPGLRIVRNPEE